MDSFRREIPRILTGYILVWSTSISYAMPSCFLGPLPGDNSDDGDALHEEYTQGPEMRAPPTCRPQAKPQQVPRDRGGNATSCAGCVRGLAEPAATRDPCCSRFWTPSDIRRHFGGCTTPGQESLVRAGFDVSCVRARRVDSLWTSLFFSLNGGTLIALMSLTLKLLDVRAPSAKKPVSSTEPAPESEASPSQGTPMFGRAGPGDLSAFGV